MRNHIPNFITCLNLLSGCLGITFMFEGHSDWAVFAMLIAAVFDFFDGFVARLLKVSSSIGKDLDSLADMVSFGLLPSIILYNLMLNSTNHNLLPYLAFSIAIFSALRLAKFNSDTTQTSSFSGLPTPASALFIAALPFINVPGGSPTYIIIAFVLSFLMVSNIRLFALKFNNYSWGDNKTRFIFLIISVLLLVFIKWYSLPAIILIYVLLSVLTKDKPST